MERVSPISMERRHLGMVIEPRKRRRRSLLESASPSDKIAILSDFREVAARDVPPQTPPGRESEIIASVVPGMEGIANEIQSLRTAVESQAKKLDDQAKKLETLEVVAGPSAAVIVRFIADYAYEVFQYGSIEGERIFRFGPIVQGIAGEKRGPVNVKLAHTIRGFKETQELDSELAKKLQVAKPLTGKLSDEFCHKTTLKTVAVCLLSESVRKYVDEKELAVCKDVTEALFGPLQEIVKSEEIRYNTPMTVPRYANRRGKGIAEPD